MTSQSSSPAPSDPAIPPEAGPASAPSSVTVTATGFGPGRPESGRARRDDVPARPVEHGRPGRPQTAGRPAARTAADLPARPAHPPAPAGSTVPAEDPAVTVAPADRADPAAGEGRTDPAAGGQRTDPVAEAGPHRPPDPGRPGGPAPVWDPVATVDLVDPPAPPGRDAHAGEPPADGSADGSAASGAGESGTGASGAGKSGAGEPFTDPVRDLVQTAVADRPLEEVVDLITSLERSPAHTRAVVDALRSAGVDRPVEDVTRLVALLTRPPREEDSADEVIRAAAAHRPVEDVTRLVALLHSEPLAPHCREEALRAAATGRSVEDLVGLIDRLAAEGVPAPASRTAPGPGSGRTDGERGHDAPESGPVPGRDGGRGVGRRTRRGGAGGREARGRARRPRTGGARSGPSRAEATRAGAETDPAARPPGQRLVRPVSWTSRFSAVLLILCAVAHFPLHHDGASARLHALALGLSLLCLVTGAVLLVRPGALVLTLAVVVPAVLAAAHVYGRSLPTAVPSRAVDLALAPPWLAGAAAVTAALSALAALTVRIASPHPGRRGAAWPPPEAGRLAD